MLSEFSSVYYGNHGHISRGGNVYLVHAPRAAISRSQLIHARIRDNFTQLKRCAAETVARIGHNKAAAVQPTK